MEKIILNFHKDVFRFIYFLFIFIPQKIGLFISSCYLIIGTIINLLLFVEHPFLKMGIIAKELVEENETSKKARE